MDTLEFKDALIDKAGLSISKHGRIIASERNMQRLRRFVLDGCVSVSGSAWSGMSEGQEPVEHSIPSAIEKADHIIRHNRTGKKIYTGGLSRSVTVSDSCEHVTFYF